MKLHIINNEKITIRTIQVFEKVFPNENKFIVLNTSRDKFSTEEFNSEIIFVNSSDNKAFWTAVGDIKQYQHVIVHFLSYQVTKLFKGVTHPSIYWIEWGADLYISLLQPKGFKLFDDMNYVMKVKSPNLPVSVSKMLYWLRRKQYQIALRNFAKKVKYFVPDSMPGEYELLLSYYPELKHLQYRGFFYYPVDSIIPDRTLISKGNNIMINHCASLTGNHIEILNRLSKIDINDKGVVIPVSYGDKTFAKDIEKAAAKQFGSSAKLLKDFMPLSEYNKVLESCDVFIYGHYRQEAVGNILIALYLGGKVFLHNYNPLLGFYKSIGLTIFSIEDDLNSDSVNTKLQQSEIKNNKRIIENYYSEEKLLQLTKESFA